MKKIIAVLIVSLASLIVVPEVLNAIDSIQSKKELLNDRVTELCEKSNVKWVKLEGMLNAVKCKA